MRRTSENRLGCQRQSDDVCLGEDTGRVCIVCGFLYEAYGANRRYRYPGSAFGSNGEGYVRMALVVNESVIEEIVDVLDASGIFKKNSIKESDI